jgi:hypothetical protein
MADSDPANTKVTTGRGDTFDRLLRAVQTVGFPIVVAGFLLWEWHSTVAQLKDTLTEVKLLLQEVRHEIKKGP